LIVIGSASVRMAAMETGSVEAAIMPVPWNFRMKQKGFKELIYAGKVMSQPLTGLATSKDRVDKQPEQARRMLRGFIRSMRAMKDERRGVIDFVAKKFSLDGPTAEETYRIMIQTLTEDGTMSDGDLNELLEETKQEAGVKRAIALRDIVDYSLLRRAAKEIGS
jgi:ABC-type nitrate/sulfonate/bicarbonate transport system substrate-binding protein